MPETVIFLAVPISIHAPVKGATAQFIFKGLDNPISIHAPVKGATKSVLENEFQIKISIHAPVKGATTGENAT